MAGPRHGEQIAAAMVVHRSPRGVKVGAKRGVKVGVKASTARSPYG
jgi:hypothetical protein